MQTVTKYLSDEGVEFDTPEEAERANLQRALEKALSRAMKGSIAGTATEAAMCDVSQHAFQTARAITHRDPDTARAVLTALEVRQKAGA